MTEAAFNTRHHRLRAGARWLGVAGWAATLAALACLALPARAQTLSCTATTAAPTCSLTPAVSMTTSRVLQIGLSVAATPLTMPVASVFDTKDADTTVTTGPVVTINASVPWSLQISATTANWTVVPAGPTKPASDLLYTWAGPVGSGLTPVALSAVRTTVTQHSAQGQRTVSPISFTYRTIWKIASDAPGAYSLVVRFSMTSP
jgi:hypothetical protein